MRSYLLKQQAYKICTYCMRSFSITVYIKSLQQENDFWGMIYRLENEDKIKMYDLCYWLDGRKIDYKLSFKYNFGESIKWNIIKYRNYLRLKLRVKELHTR